MCLVFYTTRLEPFFLFWALAGATPTSALADTSLCTSFQGPMRMKTRLQENTVLLVSNGLALSSHICRALPGTHLTREP